MKHSHVLVPAYIPSPLGVYGLGRAGKGYHERKAEALGSWEDLYPLLKNPRPNMVFGLERNPWVSQTRPYYTNRCLGKETDWQDYRLILPEPVWREYKDNWAVNRKDTKR